MREGQNPWPIAPPIAHRLGKRLAASPWQMPILRKLPDYEDKFQSVQKRQGALAPRFCTFGPWRQVTGFPGAGIAKSHGQKGELQWIVKVIPSDAEPLPQAVATGIVERQSCFMDTLAGRLCGHQNSGPGIKLKYRPWTQRQMVRANPARFHPGDQFMEVLSRHERSYYEARPGNSSSPKS